MTSNWHILIRWFLIVSSLFGAISLSAAVYIVPSDEELIRSADAIVHGRVTSTTPLLLADGTIVTDATIEPFSVLKGPQTARIIVRDEGGVVGSKAMGVSGWESYHVGAYVLTFLERRGKGYRTYGIGLGQFTQVRGEDGVDVFYRGGSGQEILGWSRNGSRHVEKPRKAAEFLALIRRVVQEDGVGNLGRPIQARTINGDASAHFGQTTMDLVPSIDSHYPASAYTSGNFRWAHFDAGQSVSFRVSGSQPGYDSTGAAQRGLAAWTTEPNSNVVYSYAGATSAGFVQDGINTIVFNSSTDVPSGAVGYARWWANAEHTFKGEKFWSISEGDVVTRTNLTMSQKAFDEVVTHELGHTLGFRHSNERAPASSLAVMNSTVSGNYGAALAPWDFEAVTHVYPGGGSTPPPPPSGTLVKGDFNADGFPDILLRNYTTGQNAVWLMSGTTLIGVRDLPALSNTSYRFEGTADFNRDGRTDILLRNYATGQNAIWLMNGTTLAAVADLPALTNLAVAFAGTGDFNEDGNPDILLRNRATGANAIWLMNMTTVAGIADLPLLANTAYQFESSGDFSGDGHPDILLRNYSTGQNAVWLMNRSIVVGIADLPALPNTAYRFDGVGDFSRDGRPDIVLRNYSTGQNALWIMNGTMLSGIVDLPHLANLSYEIAGPR